MNKISRIYYNEDLKLDFIDNLKDNNVSYVNNYTRLFQLVEPFERIHNKDLCEFTQKDLVTFFTNRAYDMKYTSAQTYTYLIESYKQWVANNTNNFVSLEVCSARDLRAFCVFKKYIVFNDTEIMNLTQNASVLDDGDYNAVIFVRTFWESDGQFTLEDFLKIKITDLDEINETLTIGGKVFKISSYIVSMIKKYSKKNKLSYRGKYGVYDVLTAEQNNGYIIRTALINGEKHKTETGLPLATNKFCSLILPTFGKKHYGESFSTKDLLMSLAIKHMVTYKKTQVEMQSERRYFSKITSHIYADMFQKYAPYKFADLYDEYVAYYNSLKPTK